MAVLKLVTYPDPRLKLVSEPVHEVNDEIRRMLDDMVETMYASEGIGLAAVQVGILKRMLVMDVAQREDGDSSPLRGESASGAPGNVLKLINPEIVEESDDESPYTEGCLSFPGQAAEVVRPAKVTVNYLDEHGQKQTLHAEGLLATCVQHEIDHLNGITFVDHLSRMKRDMVLRKLKRQQQDEVSAS